MGDETQGAGTRWRLVSSQGTEQHVSSVVMSEEEARESLDIEADVHAKFGWEVVRGAEVVVCRKHTKRGLIERTVTIRRSEPMEDDVS